MSFYRWLMQQKDRDDPVGDFALYDVSADPDFPKRIRSRRGLLNFLEREGACFGCIEAAKRAWNEYEGERQ